MDAIFAPSSLIRAVNTATSAKGWNIAGTFLWGIHRSPEPFITTRVRSRPRPRPRPRLRPRLMGSYRGGDHLLHLPVRPGHRAPRAAGSQKCGPCGVM